MRPASNGPSSETGVVRHSIKNPPPKLLAPETGRSDATCRGVEPMGLNPFLKRAGLQSSGTNRRRSTRVEFVTRIILSGRDANGQTFREETETDTVNLHGARLKTTHKLLVGMQVTIAHPQTGQAEKAVCVRVEEPAQGESTRHISVQLVRPGNVWGLENPPPDWALVAANVLGQNDPTVSGRFRALTSAVSPAGEAQAALLEKRSTELLESILGILRQQAEAITASALQEFEARLKKAEAEAGGRIDERTEKAMADVANFVETLREDMAEQLTARSVQMVDAAEVELRARVAEMLAPLMEITGHAIPPKSAEATHKK